MLTGNEDPSYERRAFDAGVDDFLVKTGNWDLVVSRVRRLLAGSPCNSERRQARSPREPNLQ
jgi:DNA-binding NarL/FixJ family response regulator